MQADVTFSRGCRMERRRLRGKTAYQPKHLKKPADQKPFLLFLLKSVLAAVALAATFNLMFGIAVISGTSMEPTLHEGDIILFWKLSATHEKGEVVFIRTEHGREDYVKRICALPGDTLDIDDDNGVLLVNGEAQKEPYVYDGTYRKPEADYPLTLGDDAYFVMGDHRSDSRDSRNYGPVSKKQIDGKALLLFRAGF